MMKKAVVSEVLVWVVGLGIIGGPILAYCHKDKPHVLGVAMAIIVLAFLLIPLQVRLSRPPGPKG